MRDLSKINFFKNKDLTHAYDNLTGVLSRQIIYDYVDYLVESNTSFTLFFGDLDYFKNINDTHGHLKGDEVLIKVSEAISNTFSEGVVGRYGGDEFIFVVEDVVDYDDVWQISRRIRSSVDKLEFTFFGQKDTSNIVTLTLGISRYPIDASTSEEIFEKSDKALYRGKLKGRNCFIIYNPELHSKLNPNSPDSMITADYMVNHLFNLLTDLKSGKKNSLKKATMFIREQYNIDRICFQVGDEIEYEYGSGMLSKATYINSKYYEDIISNKDMYFVMNNRSHLENFNQGLYDILMEQGIKSMYICKCASNNGNYGYLRIEMNRERVWTRQEKVVFIVLAKLFTLLNDFKKQ
ncbi:MAG: GGDEF domain-containing protein [Erysipelotrichaceae bacterium]|nr:GGDEF domain-containing protein [Erysipelotrichaceae bacterium]